MYKIQLAFNVDKTTQNKVIVNTIIFIYNDLPTVDDILTSISQLKVDAPKITYLTSIIDEGLTKLNITDKFNIDNNPPENDDISLFNISRWLDVITLPLEDIDVAISFTYIEEAWFDYMETTRDKIDEYNIDTVNRFLNNIK